MRSFLRLVVPLLAIASIARSQTWNGIVVDPTGAPIAGVQVRSARSSAVAVTSSDGSWTLDPSSGITARGGRAAEVGWNGSELEIELAGHQVVAIEILDAAGRRLGPVVRKALPAGRSLVPLRVPSVRAAWIAVRRGGERAIFSSRSRTSSTIAHGGSSESVGRLAAAASDTLRYFWNTKLWHEAVLASVPVTGRRDTLDVSATAISWRPTFRPLVANGLPPRSVSALRQLGDTLFAAVDSQIFSVPVAGGAWKLEHTVSGGVVDLAASGDTLFAALDSRGFGDKKLQHRLMGGGWSDDPWAADHETYRLDEWRGQLWLVSRGGRVLRHGDASRRAYTGTNGEVQGFSVIDSTRFLVNQMYPAVFDGARWESPTSVYGDLAIWWNGRVAFLRQLQSSGSWGLFTWAPGETDPVRMPDSLQVHPTDFAVAGRDLFSAVGLYSGGMLAPHPHIVGILHHRPGARVCDRIAVPPAFGNPVTLGAGRNRLWVGSFDGQIGWLE